MFFKFEFPKIELLNKSIDINLNNLRGLFIASTLDIDQKNI